jgi:hypothetical protein
MNAERRRSSIAPLFNVGTIAHDNFDWQRFSVCG